MSIIGKYVIQAGDSLESLSHQAYGQIESFRDIADVNGLDLFDELQVGAEIEIPTREQVSQAIESVTNRALAVVDELDLSSVKQKSTVRNSQLISWLY